METSELLTLAAEVRAETQEAGNTAERVGKVLVETIHLIDNETSDRATSEAQLQANIAAEATTRKNADNTLSGDIAAEAQTRQAADKTLQANIDAEAAARKEDKANLQENISTLATQLTEADSNLQDELLKRIQGRSSYSNGGTDPFIFGGSLKSWEFLLLYLDANPLATKTDGTHPYAGRVRYDIEGVIFEAQNFPINYATNKWLQVVSGGIAIDSTNSKKLARDDTHYNVCYRSRADGVWSAWSMMDVAATDEESRTIALAAQETANEAKAIAENAQAGIPAIPIE